MRWVPRSIAYHWDNALSAYAVVKTPGAPTSETEGLYWLGSVSDPVLAIHPNFADNYCYPFLGNSSSVSRFQHTWNTRFSAYQTSFGDEAVSSFSAISVVIQALYRARNTSIDVIMDTLAAKGGEPPFTTLVGLVQFGSVGENLAPKAPTAQRHYDGVYTVAPRTLHTLHIRVDTRSHFVPLLQRSWRTLNSSTL
jgi:hypothetical protein